MTHGRSKIRTWSRRTLLRSVASVLFLAISSDSSIGESAHRATCETPSTPPEQVEDYEKLLQEWGELADERLSPRERSRAVETCLSQLDFANTHAEMIEWLRKPASLGGVEAQLQLAVMMARRNWIEARTHQEDWQEVEFWLLSAFRSGNQDAGIVLAVLYIREDLKEPKPGRAREILEALASEGNEIARQGLEVMNSKSTEE